MDRAAMRNFKQKGLKLDNAVRAASSALTEMGEKIDPYKAATKTFSGQQSIDLMNEVLALEKS